MSNLRAVTILIVLAFHSFLPYLAFLPSTAYPFDTPPYRWQAFPIIDSHRWFGFDLFCAWLNLSMMALMFFIAGLFTAPSLASKGGRRFVVDRLRRIGLPLLPAVIILTPLAYYPAHRVTAADPSFGAFVQSWFALPFWPSGPQWFLWELLIFSLLAVLAFRFAPGLLARLVRATDALAPNPFRFFLAVVAITAVAYVPLSLIFSQWSWSNIGPFGFETARPLFYLVYFMLGYAVGAHGLDRGLLVCNGPLARRWWAWLALALVAFGVWGWTSSMTLGDWHAVPMAIKLGAALAFLVGCTAGCLFMLAVGLRFLRMRAATFDSLSANSYRMYLLHYLPIVWLQYALLDLDLPAIVKAAMVFGAALLITWPLAAALGNLSFGSRPIGVDRRLRRA